MAVVVMTGAAGSSGVTTTCLALAAHWPSPAVVVEADPSGSSAILAGYMRGTVPGLAGVLEAAVAMRSGSLEQTWSELLVELPGSEALLLPAVALPAQRRTMVGEWQRLGPAMSELAQSHGLDLLVDAGRLGGTGFADSLVRLADLVLLVTRSTLRSIHATSVWVEEVTAMTMDPSRVQLAVIGPGRPYPSRELSKYLGLTVARELPLDPGGAAFYSDGAAPRRKRSALDAATQHWAKELHATLSADPSQDDPSQDDPAQLTANAAGAGRSPAADCDSGAARPVKVGV